MDARNRILDDAEVSREVALLRQSGATEKEADNLLLDLRHGSIASPENLDFNQSVIKTFSSLFSYFRDKMIDEILIARQGSLFEISFKDQEGKNVSINDNDTQEEKTEKLIYLLARQKIFNTLQAELAARDYKVEALENEEGLEYKTGFKISW